MKLIIRNPFGETAVSTRNSARRPIIMMLITFMAIFGLQHTQPVSAAVYCIDSDWVIVDEAEFNQAITCFNAKPAGNYSIILTQNINLTASLATINNATADAVLLIDGAGFTVNGQRTPGIRPFDISDDTVVTMQTITISGGNIASFGGAIQNRGTLTINNSNISGNNANRGGGIESYYGTVTINDSTIDNNTALGSGGGLYIEQTAITINNSTLNGNSATQNVGGGIDNINSTLVISNSIISNNAAPTAGGIYNTSGGAATINNSTISGNSAARGGGLHNNAGSTATINNSTISGNNTSNNGGGIYNDSGTVTLTNSTVKDNTSDTSSGGIYNIDTLNITSSTISGNESNNGGGIYNDGGSLTITNSTLSENSSTNGGGAILNVGPLTISSSTISHNSAPGVSTGGGIANYASFTLRNSIIANSTSGGDCVTSTPLTDNGYNLIEDSSDTCGLTHGTNNNIIGQDPNLGPLQDNGGFTFTHALLAGSPAIDTGNSAETLDQRGIARPQSSIDDIGAYELFDCAPQPWQVGNFGQLDAAIACFNAQSLGSYTITLVQNINLPTSSNLINNAGASLTIEGDGFTIDGQDISGVRLFDILAGNITIQNLTLTGGNGPANWGGAIINWATLTIDNSAIHNNLGLNGGAIFNGGTLDVINSDISSNSADNGGGLYNTTGGTATIDNSTLSSNSAEAGGGIVNDATLTVNNSTLSENVATPEVGLGGGIYAGQGTLTINNSTLSGNQSAWNGGGIATGAAIVHISNSSIISNTADYDYLNTGYGGGISSFGDTIYFISNSIIANNWNGIVGGSGGDAPDCAVIAPSVGAGVYSQGYNLIGSTTGCLFNSAGSDILNTNALVGPLQDNGGPTLTHALLAGSPAIDAGDSAEALDQRGMPRPQGSADDIGAYELYDCTIQPWLVSDAHQLDAAITCYNTQTAAQTYTISIEQDIDLTASSSAIDNANVDPSLTIEGNGFTVDGQDIAGVRPFSIISGTVAMQNITITGGNRSGFGQEGGGIYNSDTLSLSNSTISDNAAYFGGGLYNDEGTLTITNSTLNSNSATSNGGGISNHGMLVVNNSTISNNMADTYGGAISNGGDLTLTNSTLSGNSASVADGIDLYRSTLILSNNIIANNGEDCVNDQSTVTDNGYNLIENSSAACGLTHGTNNNIVGQDPNLGPLQDNEGRTFTHALLAGSPAIDVIPTTDSSCNADGSSVDQRGGSRANSIHGSGIACDIGSFEFGATDVPTAVSLKSISVTSSRVGGTGGLMLAFSLMLLTAGSLWLHLRHKQQ